VTNVLPAIFDHYTNDAAQFAAEMEEAWRFLVHVCRRWRGIIFGSPRQLNLQLVCTNRIRAIDTPDVWPALYLIILCYSAYRIGNVDNIIAMLERRYRVCQIDFATTSQALSLFHSLPNLPVRAKSSFVDRSEFKHRPTLPEPSSRHILLPACFRAPVIYVPASHAVIIFHFLLYAEAIFAPCIDITSYQQQ
jgi:hypothetical protein